jgi:hypothetical protein
MEKTPSFNPLDYTLAIKNKGRPPKSWRWEIYAAGKSKPVRQSVRGDPSREDGTGRNPRQSSRLNPWVGVLAGVLIGRAGSPGCDRIRNNP